MAATSYSPLPSNKYAGLGSQGDLLHSANYGTYDAGVGSLVPHPNAYSANHFGHDDHPDYQQYPSYSNDYHQRPYHYDDRYAQQPNYNEDNPQNGYSNFQSRGFHHRVTPPNDTDRNYDATPNGNSAQPTHQTTTHNHDVDSDQHQRQPPYPLPTQIPPAASSDNRNNHSQTSLQSNSNLPADNHTSKQLPPTVHPSSSNSTHGNSSDAKKKSNIPVPDMKPNKSSQMRAAANRQKEESREKQRDSHVSGSKTKATPPAPTKPHHNTQSDNEQKPKTHPKRNKQQSNSVPQRKSRHDEYQTDNNDHSSGDEDKKKHHSRSKSNKYTGTSDPHHERYPPLPPLRRGRGPQFYDPYYDYPYFHGYPFRGRHPFYDDFLPYGPPPYPNRFDYRHRHLYEDGYDTPPYLPSSHTPYDGFFDYEKRKPKYPSKAFKDKRTMNTEVDERACTTDNETERDDDKKSQKSKNVKPKNSKAKDDTKTETTSTKQTSKSTKNQPERDYEDEHDMLEVWRQERNDYLKNKYKPSVHDVLYSQQWMKTDSYLESQRRRAIRDVQGYYFPYKKYTLKDYKDLQKIDAQNNLYANSIEPPSDRKERVKKREEYAAQLEKQSTDTFSNQNRTPKEKSPKRPSHRNNSEPYDSEKLSKRERAIEYAKTQVVKHRSQKPTPERSADSDPTERFVDGLFPPTNDEDN